MSPFNANTNKNLLPAGALLYAIFLCLVIGILSGMVVLYGYTRIIETENETHRSMLINNVKSAFELYKGMPELFTESSGVIDLYSDGNSEVTYEKTFWGFYEILKCEARWKSFSFSKKALMGEDVLAGEKTGLYLADHNDHLSLAGSIKIGGLVFLPKKGIKRAYIEGRGYTSDGFSKAQVRQSNGKVPDINKSLVEQIERYFPENLKDSVTYFEYMADSNDIQRTFDQKTLVIFSKEEIVLERKNIIGNIIIISGKSIEVKNTCTCVEILLVAPYIKFCEDFTGSVQAFARDSIRVEEDVTLKYPSVLALFSNGIAEKGIVLEPGSKISGTVVVFEDPITDRPKSIVTISREAIVEGIVYSNAYVDLQGEIHGSLYCDNLVLRTRSGVYVNHLMDVVIDPEKLSSHFTGVSLFEKPKQREVVKWML